MNGREEYNPKDSENPEKKPYPDNAVEVVRNARPQLILEIIRQMKQTALEYKATFSGLNLEEQQRLLPRYDRIDGLIAAVEAKAQKFAQSEAQFGTTGHQELVIFLGKDESGQVVGLNLLELLPIKKWLLSQPILILVNFMTQK